MQLGLNLLYGFILFSSTVSFSKNIIGDISLIKDKNSNNLIVTSAFQDFFQIFSARYFSEVWFRQSGIKKICLSKR